MSIEKIRSEHEQGFGRLDMKTIKDPRLTYAEVGLLFAPSSPPHAVRLTNIVAASAIARSFFIVFFILNSS